MTFDRHVGVVREIGWQFNNRFASSRNDLNAGEESAGNAAMADALWMRLREVHWGDYEVSTGKAERLDKLLQDLASRKEARAMRASQDVWRLLCSGGIRSAAIPVVPFLVEIIDVSGDNVRCEILDILKSCALGVDKLESALGEQLREALITARNDLFWLRRKAKGDVAIAVESFYDVAV
ncbi:hypothetical protein [Rubritalea halochordaticola]